ncbi:MAG: hypothetical protein QOD77_857 [Thermoplasmata archaeon]|nr:hypothetical protein [Thermoplasmata archaeon]
MNTKTLVAALAAVLVAGCMSPANAPLAVVQIDAETALDMVRALLPGTAQLVYVSGSEGYTSFTGAGVADGALQKWTIGYYVPEHQAFHLVDVFADGTTAEQDLPAAMDYQLYVQPVSPTVTVGSAAALKAAVTALKASLATPTVGDTINYWLSKVGTLDVWQIVFMPAVGTPSTIYVDAFLGTVTALVPSAEIDMDTAITTVEASPGLLLPGDQLVEVTTVESQLGGSIEVYLNYHDLDSLLFAPDLFPGDGKAVQWVLIYHNANTGETYPIILVGGLVPVKGDSLTTYWTADEYTAMQLSGTYMDADDAMAAAGVAPGVWSQYTLTKRTTNPHPLWRITASQQRLGGVFVIDATDGSLVA